MLLSSSNTRLKKDQIMKIMMKSSRISTMKLKINNTKV